mgnify:CR=1 FL=1
MDDTPNHVSVDTLFRDMADRLDLHWIAGRSGGARVLSSETIQKPTLALIGHLNFVHPNRVQVLGCAEMDYLRALPETKKPPFRIPPKGLPRTGLKKTLRFLQAVNMLFRIYLSRGIAKRTDRLLDGNEVMKAAGVPEGPEIGRLLDQVNLLHFEGRLKTRKEALDWLRKRRKRRPPPARP